MKGFLGLCLVVALTGCGTKSVVQKWEGSQPALLPYAGPVCLLPTPLPESVDSVFLGRAVANQQWYGGYAKVNQALADVARASGADIVGDKHQHMKIGFFAWARPQVWGYAARLKHPESFDCVANGGTVYGGAIAATATNAARPVETYDSCMARVLRITDPKLRLSSMSICDGAK